MSYEKKKKNELRSKLFYEIVFLKTEQKWKFTFQPELERNVNMPQFPAWKEG